MQETTVRFLVWEDSLEKGQATHSCILRLPFGSAGKESACNAEDPGSIPGMGSTPGEGISYLLQYSWVFLVAQMVNNPPAMREN